MSNGTDEGLTGQQLQAMQKRMAEMLQAIRDQIELRKQCLEMAVRATSTVTPPGDVLALARGMYDFLIEPAAEVKIWINPPGKL